MKIGFVQMNPVFGSKEQNLRRVEELISSTDADILVLPELFTTGYVFQERNELVSLAEKIPGKSTSFLENICKKKKICVVAGMAEKEGDIFFNSAVVVGETGLIGTYRKIHLFLEEKIWFSPGNLGFKIFSYQDIKIGVMICFDWWFPEAARTLSLQGAHIICHPANLVLPYCQQAMLTRSLENRVFTITANRIGLESRSKKSLNFTGASQVADTLGNRLIQAPVDKESVMVVEINPKDAENKQLTPMNNLWEDRRPEYYRV